MRAYILPVRETVVGGPRGGEAYFNGLLKEINGLQMAQSIYSNETPSVAMSIEQRAGGACSGGGGEITSGQNKTAQQRFNRPGRNYMSAAPGRILNDLFRIIASQAPY